jgi:hypothetical protein
LSTRFIHQLLRQAWSPAESTRVIDTIREKLLRVFECLPDDLNNNNFDKRIKAMPFFCRAIENMVILFHAISYIVKIHQNEFSLIKFGTIIKFFILLAQNLPGHATEQRYNLLVGFYTLYNTIFKNS